MSFLGQFNFGYPVTTQNIITTIPDDAIIPLSIGSSLQGNVLGTSFADLKSQVGGGLPSFLEYNETTRTFWNNGNGNQTTNLTFGEFALQSNTTGNNNTAIGHNALQANTSGTWNTGVGSYALAANTTGILNTAMGFEALLVNTTGFRNTAFGVQALTSNTTGIKNVALGTESLSANITGVENTAVGDGTYNGSTGNRNTLVGFQAGANNFNECVVLGRSAAATANNQFVVGSTTYNAGSVTTEVNTSSRVWNVIINGVARKILLA